MTRKTRPYSEILIKRLENPVVAAHYLNETLYNSPDNFLNALKNVAKAHQMAKVAKESGIQRETLYRSLSEQGNPTWDTLTSLFGALRLKFIVHPDVAEENVIVTAPVPQPAKEAAIPIAVKITSNPLSSAAEFSSVQLEMTGGYENAFWIPPSTTTNQFLQEALQ